jgi:NAD(P)-dependent dehydrogenase (short-subunit alcohol dehydrogenase family)
MTLDRRVALITGGGSGIGRAAALRFARDGIRTTVVGRSADELDAVVAEIAAQGSDALAIEADVSDFAALQRAVQMTTDRFGRLDYVVANAGINGVWAPVDQLATDEWDETLRINLSGTFYTVKAALPALKRQGGAIVIVSSVNGTRMFSNTGASAYATSKAGQVAFAKMIAVEFAQFGIRVNAICPGAIETSIDENTEKRAVDAVKIPVEYPAGQIPLTGERPGSAAQVADLVAFLCSDAASHIAGSEIWIDGAQSLLVG